MPKGAGGREDHLCGAPSGLPLPWFRAAKHLHLVAVGGRGGVTEIRYWQYNTPMAQVAWGGGHDVRF